MKSVKYLTLLVISLLWIGGCSQSVMRFLGQNNIIADDYRFGDLYRLSNLPQFKDTAATTPCQRRSVATDSGRTHLYVIGDSFTEPQRVAKEDFPVSYFRRVQWDKKDTIQLDTTANNVLLIESVERHFREHAAPSALKPIDNLLVVSDSNKVFSALPDRISFGKQLVDLIHSAGIEERLETILFSHNLFLWFRQLKASLTLSAFDRVSPNVSLSKNRQHVFIALDTDTTKRQNAGTSPIADDEVKGLVNTINEAATHYKSAGFDRVLLSIIPNKATILDPQPTYNHLIERVQSHPQLNIPTVDVYRLFQRQTQSVYALGDSHWNCTGRSIWLSEVAKKL